MFLIQNQHPNKISDKSKSNIIIRSPVSKLSNDLLNLAILKPITNVNQLKKPFSSIKKQLKSPIQATEQSFFVIAGKRFLPNASNSKVNPSGLGRLEIRAKGIKAEDLKHLKAAFFSNSEAKTLDKIFKTNNNINNSHKQIVVEETMKLTDSNINDFHTDFNCNVNPLSTTSVKLNKQNLRRSKSQSIINNAEKLLEDLNYKLCVEEETKDILVPCNGDCNTKVESRSTIKSPCSDFEDGCLHSWFFESHFPFVPPTIKFALPDEKVKRMPKILRKCLLWKYCAITPHVVKDVLTATGFKLIYKGKWIGYWGKHLKPDVFKTVHLNQKINHFPGTFQIGRKDCLWRNLQRLKLKFGPAEFGFIPQTYCLPADLLLIKARWVENKNKRWIIKPPACARGVGVRVINRWDDIPMNRSTIVQRYISNPFLINGNKFDLRIYVYVTSFNPLVIYVYKEGLARFASAKYSNLSTNIHNSYMHLTNYSVNKHNSEYFIDDGNLNEEGEFKLGYKWSLSALWSQLRSQSINTEIIWNKIKDLIVKTLISCEANVNQLIRTFVKSAYCVNELFGFDILLDDDLKPWLLEVNISPSLNSNSQLDKDIKSAMVKDLLNLSGYNLPDKKLFSSSSHIKPTEEPSNEYCMDPRLFSFCLAHDEKKKHDFYLKTSDYSSILTILTPDDIRVIIRLIDEDNRRGSFERVHPLASSDKYFVYFEKPRYYNILLQQWLDKYSINDPTGVGLIADMCHNQVHLLHAEKSDKYTWHEPKKANS